MKTRFRLLVSVLFFALVANALAEAPDTFQIDPQMKAERQKALDRPRRIIWNHDGGGSIGVTKDNLQTFLDHGRPLTRLIGSQVDTIMFCSSSDFGTSDHFTKVGHIVDSNYEDIKPIRMDTTHLENYLDPLKVVVDFGHAHNMEVFGSMRMNDTHDAGGHVFSPGMLAANPFKQQHPEWLLGTRDKPPFHGKWTGVNYEIPEVRDYVFRLAQEVCQNYDVDGLEFDFFRHPTFFKYAGPDATATQAQRDLMTDMMRRIRTMADAVGKKRGRPILISVKVPDSLDYDKAIGLDLEHWLSDGLVDMLVPGGYIRMEDWSASVDLGHRYGVKVYPSMDDVRFDVPKPGKILDSSQALRIAAAGYRGRAIEAWAAHADGIYLFDFFSGSILKVPYNVLKELGDPGELLTKDRTYFGSYMGLGKIAGGGFPNKAYQKIETLSPVDPKPVSAGASALAHVNIPEDFSSEKTPAITIKLRFAPAMPPDQMTATINGKILSAGKSDGDWIDYACAPNIFVKGINRCEVALTGTSPGTVEWRDLVVEVKPDEAGSTR